MTLPENAGLRPSLELGWDQTPRGSCEGLSGFTCYALVPWALLVPGSGHFRALLRGTVQHPQWQRSPPGGEEDADAGNKICAAEFGAGLWLVTAKEPRGRSICHAPMEIVFLPSASR